MAETITRSIRQELSNDQKSFCCWVLFDVNERTLIDDQKVVGKIIDLQFPNATTESVVARGSQLRIFRDILKKCGNCEVQASCELLPNRQKEQGYRENIPLWVQKLNPCKDTEPWFARNIIILAYIFPQKTE